MKCIHCGSPAKLVEDEVEITMERGPHAGRTVKVRQEWWECARMEHWYLEEGKDEPTIEGWIEPSQYQVNFECLQEALNEPSIQQDEEVETSAHLDT